MARLWTSLGIKFLTVWVVLLLLTVANLGPTAMRGAIIAAFVALISYGADRVLPFKLQGVTRWAMDSGVAALSIWVVQWLMAGPRISFLSAIIAGALIGAIEIPLHFWLAGQFGLRKRNDRRDGIS